MKKLIGDLARYNMASQFYAFTLGVCTGCMAFTMGMGLRNVAAIFCVALFVTLGIGWLMNYAYVYWRD